MRSLHPIVPRRRDRNEERRLASDRMHRLLDAAAAEAIQGNHALADRYAFLLRRLAMRYQTGLPAEARTRICRVCGAHLLSGTTARTRLRKGKVVTTCTKCGHARRRPVRSRP